MRKVQGFTLLELMVTVAIIAIISAIATPAMQSFIESSSIRSEVQRVSGLFSLARSHAITNNQALIVFGSVNNGVLSVDVYTDGNGDATLTFEAGVDTYIERSPGSVTTLSYGGDAVVFADNAVQFDNNGRLAEPGPGVLTFCDAARTSGKQLSINAIGRVTVSDIANPAAGCL